MKKFKKLYIVILLIMVIGFAAVSTSLFINGTSFIGTNKEDFDVFFSGAIQDDLDKSNVIISADKKSITFNVDTLKTIGDTSTLDYEITNNSTQYDVNVSIDCSMESNDLVKLEQVKTPSFIEAKTIEEGKIKVTLNRALLEDTTIEFTCNIVAEAGERTNAAVGTFNNQNYSVSGYFVDESGNNVSNANLVIFSSTPHYVTTDIYGYFYVENLERGEHEIYFLDDSMDNIKEMSKEEIIEKKLVDAKFSTNIVDETIVVGNSYKIVSFKSSTEKNKTFSISLDSAGGVLEETKITVTENTVYGELPTPSKLGYNFLGWFLEDKLITKDTYVVGTNITKLVAKYGTGEYLVTFDTDGGTVEPNTKKVKYTENYGELPIPIKKCYTFDGWYDGEKLITSTSIVDHYENFTLIAKWIPNIFTVNSSGYNGVYDLSSHGITVTPNIDGATVEYSIDGEIYSTENPMFTDAGEYTVYYRVTRDNYLDVFGSEKVIITKKNNMLSIDEKSGVLTYPTNHTFKVIENTSDGELSVNSSDTNVVVASILNNVVTLKPGTESGNAVVTIISAATKNYNEASVEYSVTVNKGTINVTSEGYNAIYDGNAHGISVSTSLTGATISYSTDNKTFSSTNPTYTNAGEYTVYYKVEMSGYNTATGSEKITITQASNTLSIDKTSGEITYPGTDVITVSTDTTVKASTSNSNIATVSVSNNKVTVTAGTTSGVATITITTVNDSNHTAVSATYKATVKKGTLKYTASNFTGTYDKSAHGISITDVTSGATVKYGNSSGTYNLTASPTRTDAGTTTVYYQITKEGYNTVTGSKTITINKANGSVTLSGTNGTITTQDSISFTVKSNLSSGKLSVASNDTAIASATISGTTITVKPGTKEGTANITVTSAATTNYKAASAVYKATLSHKYSTSAKVWTINLNGNNNFTSVWNDTTNTYLKYEKTCEQSSAYGNFYATNSYASKVKSVYSTFTSNYQSGIIEQGTGSYSKTNYLGSKSYTYEGAYNGSLHLFMNSYTYQSTVTGTITSTWKLRNIVEHKCSRCGHTYYS